MTIIETIMNGKKGKERLNPFGCKGLVMVLRGPFCHHRKPGRLKKFVKDLHSGKLHREFHHGPDPAEQGHEEEEVS